MPEAAGWLIDAHIGQPAQADALKVSHPNIIAMIATRRMSRR